MPIGNQRPAFFSSCGELCGAREKVVERAVEGDEVGIESEPSAGDAYCRSIVTAPMILYCIINVVVWLYHAATT